MKNVVLRFNDVVYKACIWVAGLSIAVMALIIPVGIFYRYVLNAGLSWPEPVSILLMVLFTFIGAAAGYRANAHMAVAMVSDRLPDSVQPIITVFVRIAMGAIALFMTIWGYKLCVATWYQYLDSIPFLRVGISYAPIPLGGALTLLFVIEQLLYGDQSKRRAVDYEADDSKEAV
ncbi:TRAP transporter small permease [Pseudomonas sp. Marseille-QA0892]